MFCEICGRPLADCERRVRLASDSDLRNPLYLTGLVAAMRALGLARRAWRDAIADALRDYEGELAGPDGAPIEAPLVDDHFPTDDDQRWLSDFVKDRADGSPVRLTRRTRERVRLIDLYFRLRAPAVAATFGRLVPANDNARGPDGQAGR